MKKIKYLLFIIPLLFVFITSSKAFVLLESNGVTYDEQYIKEYILTRNPDFDFEVNKYMWCNVSNYVECFFFGDDFYNAMYVSRVYSDNIMFTSYNSMNKYKYSSSNSGSFTLWTGVLVFYFNSSTHSYTNFLNSDMTNKYGSEGYNVLSLVEFEPEPEPDTPTINNKIYLPDELEEGNCPIILNKDTIRVYEEEPQTNVSVNYIDYFINSHYIKQTGEETLSDTVNCLDLEDFTTSYVYRFDFDRIMIIFIAILFIIAYPTMKIIHAFFIGFKRR